MKARKWLLNLEEFGTAIGLNPLDKEVIHQKIRMINYLKGVRIKKGVSQVALAKRLGTRQPAIARMEAGYVGEVSFDFIVRVALALGAALEVTHTRKAA